jgi:hypothetical protein
MKHDLESSVSALKRRTRRPSESWTSPRDFFDPALSLIARSSLSMAEAEGSSAT